MPYAAAPMVTTLACATLIVLFVGGMIACAIEIFVGDYRARRSTRQP